MTERHIHFAPTSKTGDLTVTITPEFDRVSHGSQSLDLMLTLNAPEYESEEREKRAPIDIVCVIDKSGSMKGIKMDLMKKTLSFMIDQLKSCDRIALVTFDTSVDTTLNLIAMDEQGKKRAKLKIDEVQAGTSTNLSGGLLEGLDIIKKRVTKSDVASILLFTDGLANVGVTKSPHMVTMVQKLMSAMNNSSTLFTFGFGSDHDANMLRAMAEAGNGLYYYLDSVDAIPETFSDCLGGLLSVVAQNIKIQICTLDNGVSIGHINSAYKKIDMRPGHEIEIVVGDIYSEETKNIVFTVTLPWVRSDIYAQELVRITATYFDVVNTETKSVETMATISRIANANLGFHKPNVKLDQQRNRVRCTEALERGREMANNNQLEEARKLLNEAIGNIKQSETRSDNFCNGLIQDLNDCLADMVDQDTYVKVGSKKMNNYWMSSKYERSTNTKSAAQASYGTKSKSKHKTLAKHYTK